MLIILIGVVLRYNRILRVHKRIMSVNNKLIGGTRESVSQNAEKIVAAAEIVGKNAEKIEHHTEQINKNQGSIKENAEDIQENAEGIKRNADLIEANKKMIVACQATLAANNDAIVKMREQVFLYESRMTQLNGYWILENKGERKYFEPGRVVKVESGDERTEFSYDEKSVTCTLFKNGKKSSVHVFTLSGAPVSGEIYDRGKCVQHFEYNELGQVCEVR